MATDGVQTSAYSYFTNDCDRIEDRRLVSALLLCTDSCTRAAGSLGGTLCRRLQKLRSDEDQIEWSPSPFLCRRLHGTTPDVRFKTESGHR